MFNCIGVLKTDCIHRSIKCAVHLGNVGWLVGYKLHQPQVLNHTAVWCAIAVVLLRQIAFIASSNVPYVWETWGGWLGVRFTCHWSIELKLVRPTALIVSPNVSYTLEMWGGGLGVGFTSHRFSAALQCGVQLNWFVKTDCIHHIIQGAVHLGNSGWLVGCKLRHPQFRNHTAVWCSIALVLLRPIAFIASSNVPYIWEMWGGWLGVRFTCQCPLTPHPPLPAPSHTHCSG